MIDKTDKKAALSLAQLHAAGLLPGIWIPPVEVRELRAVIAQRRKMVKLASIAKCRLHSLLHRHDIELPEGFEPFSEDMRAWWEHLKISPLERQLLLSDLATLDFAKGQVHDIEETIKELAAKEERIPLLVQITGIGLLTSITILAAIGDISRFPSAKQLVGYAGLGARVHASGESFSTGRITKSGRKDLRWAMVEAARHAVQDHPHFKLEYERLGKTIGRKKATVAIARKLLVMVWHMLAKGEADKYANSLQMALGFYAYAHRVHTRNLPGRPGALQFTRDQLDRLGLGQELISIPWNKKHYHLPPSRLRTKQEV